MQGDATDGAGWGGEASAGGVREALKHTTQTRSFSAVSCTVPRDVLLLREEATVPFGERPPRLTAGFLLERSGNMKDPLRSAEGDGESW